MNGGEGDDLLVGGVGNDTLPFHARFGYDTAEDFKPGADLIDFSELGIGYADPSIQNAFGGILVTVGPGETVFLKDISAGDLDQTDFVL